MDIEYIKTLSFDDLKNYLLDSNPVPFNRWDEYYLYLKIQVDTADIENINRKSSKYYNIFITQRELYNHINQLIIEEKREKNLKDILDEEDKN